MTAIRGLKLLAAIGLVAAVNAGGATADDPVRKRQEDPVKQRDEKADPVKREKADPVKKEQDDPVKKEKAEPEPREKSQPVKVDQSGDKQKQPAAPIEKGEGTKAELTDAQRSALAFAKANHPELARLLAQLQASNPRGFQTAIEELTRAQERLLRVQERTPDRYESELSLWKLDSRIRLLAAQSAMSDSDGARAELRGLLQERRDLRLARLRDDQSRQQARLEKLNATIAELEAGGDAAVDAELEQLLTRAQNRARDVKPRSTSPTTTQPANDRKQP